MFARNFYDLGCRHTAEKYDEIEYNRQRAEESPLPEDTVLFNRGVEEGKRLMMEEFPKWRKIKAGERLPCPAYVWTIAYDNYPDCFEGRLTPNIKGVKVGRDTWYLPVDVIHNLPKEDEK